MSYSTQNSSPKLIKNELLDSNSDSKLIENETQTQYSNSFFFEFPCMYYLLFNSILFISKVACARAMENLEINSKKEKKVKINLMFIFFNFLFVLFNQNFKILFINDFT
jgi:hypothetical protein